MIEKEYKFLLSEAEFLRLKKFLVRNMMVGRSVCQVNHYFYNSKTICNLKLRVINDFEYLITVKKRLSIKDNVSIAEEYSLTLDQEQASLILSEKAFHSNRKVIDFLIEHGIEDPTGFQLIGHLITYRSQYYLQDYETPIELDENYYLGAVDYEVEWEVEPQLKSKKVLLDVFAKSQIMPTDSTVSKTQRFLDIRNL